MSSTAEFATPVEAFVPGPVIAHDRSFVLLPAKRVVDESEVWLKFARPTAKTSGDPDAAAELRHEAAVAAAVGNRAALTLVQLHETATGPLLEFEHFAGSPLSASIASDGLAGEADVAEFLTLAQSVTAALAILHAHRFVHKRLSPEGIYFDRSSRTARIGNLGRAVKMQGKSRELATFSQEVAGMAYLSPEQTGRLNWAVGFGCDLYALGVIFYQLLTGKLPFTASDPLAWVHCHVARTPRSPAEVNPSIPPVLAAIVLKLLAKNPADRYLSASGLLADLSQAEQVLEESSSAVFLLGEMDRSQEFQLPDRLYGRAADFARLSTALDRVRAGSNQFLTIAGAPGAGKSSLVYEWYGSGRLQATSVTHPAEQREVPGDWAGSHVTEFGRRPLFGAGKYERAQRDQPYFGLRQALQALCRSIASEPEDRRAEWKLRLNAALGRVGRVMTDTFPALLPIMGEQPPVPDLAPAESRNRFNEAFRKLMGTFADPEHPMVLFLDDVQWADRSSLALLEPLLTASEQGGMVLMVGYRNDDASDLEGIEHTLAELKEHGVARTALIAEPLSSMDVCALLADTMGGNPARFESLAEMIRQKTGGNPFFVRQFLQHLAEEELIAYDHGWQWDEAAISQANVTDNVVAFVAARIGRLPQSWRELLETCSCFASKIRRDLLPQLLGKTETEITADLEGAMASGAFVLRGGEYAFVHDRVREAASLLVSPARVPALHLQMAHGLLNQPEAQIEQDIFDIVYHLAGARSLIDDPGLQLRARTLNLRAAQRARNAAAYGPALDYARAAYPPFEDALWSAEYDLCANAALLLSECLFFNQQTEEFERFNVALLHRLVTSEHIVPLRRMMILALSASSRHAEAVASTEEALRYLDSPIPSDLSSTFEALGEETARINALLTLKGGIEALRTLPSFTDARVEAIVGILMSITPDTVMLGLGALYALAVARAVRLSIEHGYSMLLPVVAANYAVVVYQTTGDVHTAYRWSQLAAAIDAEHGGSFHAPANFIPAWLVNCWKLPVSSQIAVTDNACRAGLEQGDILFGCFSAAGTAVFTAWSGTPLPETVRQAERNRAIIHGRVYSADFHCLLERQFARALMGLTQGRTSLADAQVPATELEAVRETKSAHQVGYYLVTRLRLAYLFGERDEVFHWAAELIPYAPGIAGLLIQADNAFYYALSLLDRAGEALRLAGGQNAHESIQEAEGCLASLRVFAQGCPENFLAYQLILEAELARAEQRLPEACALFSKAVVAADRSSLIHHSALACELAVRANLDSGDRIAARAYLREALNRYQTWGAVTKVQDLTERYRELHHHFPAPNAAVQEGSFREQSLDLLSLMKAAEAISGEIVMKQLVDRMMRTLIESACAEWGALVLLESGSLVLKAVQRATDTAPTELLDEPLAVSNRNTDLLPQGLLQHVMATGEPLVLADARRAPEFATDPVIQRMQCRSILCAPILHKGSLSGLIYLENNLSTGVFTPERLEFLRLLSSQIAVSLENARYHERTLEWERLQSDLDAARAIQLSLLPQKMPDSASYQLAIRSSACYEVGGDYTDVLPETEDEWVMVVADVAGKGLASAMVASSFRSAFRAIAGTGLPLHEIAGRLGQLHWSEGNEARRRYVTAAFLRLNHCTNRLEVVNAGHNPVVIVYPDRTIRRFRASAPPLGMLPGLSYTTESVDFPPGARLLAYTDGLTEVFQGEDEFGEDRLFRCFRDLGADSPNQALESIWRELSAFSSDSHQRDDMTALALCRLGSESAA